MVTGTGSVGLAVLREFAEQGYDVISYDMQSPSNRTASFFETLECKLKVVPGDIRDSSRLIDAIKTNCVEGIVHTAALTSRGSGVTHPTAQFSVNAEGTLTVLEAARIMDLRRIIFTSSISVFGNVPPNRTEPLKETERIDPSKLTSFYAAAKYTSELLMDLYHRLYGMETVTCRLDTVYGIGEINPRDIGAFLWAVLSGERIVEKSGADVEADYTYSKDVARGISLLYQIHEITDPRIYHLSNGRKYRLGDVVEIVNSMGTGKVELGPGKEGKYSTSKYDPPPVSFDISRAKSLGYMPRPIKQSLEDYAIWVKTEIRKGRFG
jgi:nucleoside-diphosphate-sugar epimerase